MPADPRKRQKKAEQRAAKRKAKHHELARAKSLGLAERIKAAARFPILDSWVGTNLWEEGMGWACLSRLMPNGQVVLATFLIDRYCLGVKDAMAVITSRYEYDSQLRELRSRFGSEDKDPASVRKLVEEAVAYARSIGFPPHPDYQKARHIFGTIDAGQSKEQFEFGDEGKPFFIAGPYDDPQRCRSILSMLEQKCGPDGFKYTIPFTDELDAYVPDSLQTQPFEVVGPEELSANPEWRMTFSPEPDETVGEE